MNNDYNTPNGLLDMRVGAILAVLVLSLPVSVAGFDVETPCPWVPGIGEACLREDGLYDVIGSDGTVLGVTHGPDRFHDHYHAASEDEEAPAPVAVPAGVNRTEYPVPINLTGHHNPRGVVCADPGDPYKVEAIHMYPWDRYNSYNEDVDWLRGIYDSMSNIVENNGDWTEGHQIRIRFACDGNGDVIVHNVEANFRAQYVTFSRIVEAAQAAGHVNPYTKYLVYWNDFDSFRDYCDCDGLGQIAYDDRPSGNSALADSPAFATFAQSPGYTFPGTPLHEIAHNLGAVQHSAPHSTGAAHCTDGDLMCYNDGGPTALPQTRPCGTHWSVIEATFDCGKDDYFNPDPEPGSYLATHWNLGDTRNLFFDFDHVERMGVYYTQVSGINGYPAYVQVRAKAYAPGGYVMNVTSTDPTLVPEQDWSPSKGEAFAGTFESWLPGDYAFTLNFTSTDDPTLTKSITVNYTVVEDNLGPWADIEDAPTDGEVYWYGDDLGGPQEQVFGGLPGNNRQNAVIGNASMTLELTDWGRGLDSARLETSRGVVLWSKVFPPEPVPGRFFHREAVEFDIPPGYVHEQETFTLIVRDVVGNEDSDSVTLTVTSPIDV